MKGNPSKCPALTAPVPFASMGDRKESLAERVKGMKPSHRKGLLAALLLLFGVGGLTGSLSQGEAAQAQAEDRSRQAKARMYDVLTGVLFAMTLLSLVGAAITQAAGFVALLLVSASLLGVAWIGYLVAVLHGGTRT